MEYFSLELGKKKKLKENNYTMLSKARLILIGIWYFYLSPIEITTKRYINFNSNIPSLFSFIFFYYLKSLFYGSVRIWWFAKTNYNSKSKSEWLMLYTVLNTKDSLSTAKQ
ncbi:hypothetical protein BpHYR1_044333 [Brachionus plicatilis]|uniref:Uncharacterized protein n=1 Tax=Brachionus plicatilis TaxID=10195 RepID=A0A3M7RSL6_BRAPC|nr:hypothetical protein BpHYR1_044333 [Brachionus plicatilis]